MHAVLVSVILGSAIAGGIEPAGVAVVPKPVAWESREGSFDLAACSKITVTRGSSDLARIGDQLAASLAGSLGRKLSVEPADDVHPARQAILLSTTQAKATRGDEGYELTITPESIVIRAQKPAGVFYGVQTLRQLMPAERKLSRPSAGRPYTVPCLQIEDQPRFAWRGMSLDVARHFFPKEFVKRYIDYLAACKINVFHLYLT